MTPRECVMRLLAASLYALAEGKPVGATVRRLTGSLHKIAAAARKSGSVETRD